MLGDNIKRYKLDHISFSTMNQAIVKSMECKIESLRSTRQLEKPKFSHPGEQVGKFKKSMKNYRTFTKCMKIIDRMPTGSKSKGKREHYYYYHCQPDCGTRFNAIKANDIFLDQLKEINLNEACGVLGRKS